MRSPLPFLALTTIAACSGEVALTPTSSTTGTGGASTITSTSGTGGSSTFTTTSGSGGAPLAITGTCLDTHVTDNGEIVAPRDPSTVSISAMTQRADGGWDTYPGTLDASGAFVIPGVPLGTSYVMARAVGFDWVDIEVTSERSVAFTRTLPGRPDATPRAQPTTIGLQIAGSEGWDAVGVGSVGAGVFAAAACPAGCTDVPHYLQFDKLIDAAKGDRTWVLHRTSKAPALTKVIDSACLLTGFTVHDGVPATLSCTPAPVPQQPLHIAWDPAAFTPAPEGVPAEAAGSAVYLMVGPGTQEAIPIFLLERDLTSAEDGVIDTFYGALDTGWPLTANFAVSTQRQVGSGGPWVFGGVAARGPLARFTQGTLAPPLSLPRDVRVNGQPAYLPLAGVGASPTISWGTPAVGTPDHYLVRLSAGAGGTIEPYGMVRTRDPQITIPPGVLAATTGSITVTAHVDDAQTGLSWDASVSEGSFSP
jgi:hypothetical protein